MRFFVWIVILFFVELGLFVVFSEYFGFLSLVLEIIASGIFGVFLLFSSLSGSQQSVIELLQGAKNPNEVLASNFAKCLGSILLIIPGLLSDCLGILLYFGFLDSVLSSFLGKLSFKNQNQTSQSNVIDVEVLNPHKGIEDEESHYRK